MKPKPAPTGSKPATLLDRLRAIINPSTEPKVVDLERAANDAAQARDAALAAKAQLEGQRADMALAPDAERAAYRARLAEAADMAETLAVVADRINGRLDEARAAEEQARRQAIYDNAKARADAAARAIATQYTPLCNQLLGLLKELAEAQQVVASANAQLPDGTAAIDDPEIVARSVAYRPREVLSEKKVERWVRLDESQPVPEEYQARIKAVKDGWGARAEDLEPAFLRARFWCREVRRQHYGEMPQRLATGLRLPVLRGAGLLWGIGDEYGGRAMSMADLSGQSSPDHVLASVAVALAPSAGATAAPSPDVVIEWELIEYVGATPLRPLHYKSYSRGDGETPASRQAETYPRPIGSSEVGLVPSAGGIAAAKRAAPPTRLISPAGVPTSVTR